MATALSVVGDANINGDLRLTGGLYPKKSRDDILALSDLEPFVIPITSWRVWDAMQTNLPGTAATDDLALVGGTFGTASPTIQSVDFGGTTTTAYARAVIALPWEYDDGQTVTLRFHAGMLTTIADASCTLDVVCYESDEEAGIGADICATAAQSINSTTFADIDFTITPTNLAAGDTLDVRITITGTDAGDAGAGITGTIGVAQLLCDVR